MKPLNIMIGYDHCEEVAYHVLASSIMRYSTVPVSITPISLEHFREFYKRERDPKQSNAFSFSRFLVPYLSGYQGFSLFMDCDMVMKCDVKEIFDYADESKAVICCQHDYSPKSKVKYLGNIQYPYPRKNWSSVMLFNNDKCRVLTPAYIENNSGLHLHRFEWLNDSEIGELPLEYNWLVGEYPHNDDAKVLHYTLGGPYFDDYRETDHAADWYGEKRYATHCAQRRA